MALQAHAVVNTIALFDLDGTITRADTMLEFLAFTKGRARTWFLLGAVFPTWCLAKLGIAAGSAPKHAVLRLAFRGMDVRMLEETAVRFARERMPALLRPKALERIHWHQAQGDRVIIVTASCSLWVNPWCREHAIELIATELEQSQGTFTGRLATANCKGEEKVRRIRATIGDMTGVHIHAYGDTPSDRPMLQLASSPHYRVFA